jgi:hypothetical protein
LNLCHLKVLYSGNKGPIGDEVPSGNKGLSGDKGPTGNKGPIGDKGQSGIKGLSGDKGPTFFCHFSFGHVLPRLMAFEYYFGILKFKKQSMHVLTNFYLPFCPCIPMSPV